MDKKLFGLCVTDALIWEQWLIKKIVVDIWILLSLAKTKKNKDSN